MPTTARQSSALPGRQILQRGDLGRVVLLALGWPAPPPRPLGRRRLLPLAGSRRIDLAHRDEALAFDGLHGQAAAGGGSRQGY